MQDNTKAVEAIMDMYKNSEKGHAKKPVEEVVDLGKKQHEKVEEAKFLLNNPAYKDELE